MLTLLVSDGTQSETEDTDRLQRSTNTDDVKMIT